MNMKHSSENINVKDWESRAIHGLEWKEFTHAGSYLLRVMRLFPRQLLINVMIYLSILVLLYALTTLSNTYIYSIPSSDGDSVGVGEGLGERVVVGESVHSNWSMMKVIVIVFTTSLLSTIIRPYMFYLSNTLVKDILWRVSLQDILLSLYHFHPLWLGNGGGSSGGSLSSSTIRERVILGGLSAFAKVLNRFSYLGPMIVTLAASIYVLGKIDLTITFVFVSTIAMCEIWLLNPAKEAIAKERYHLLKTSRNRFLTMEKLDFARIPNMKTRGPGDYTALVERITAYQDYYNQILYPADRQAAFLSALAGACMEILAACILIWLLFTSPALNTAAATDGERTGSTTESLSSANQVVTFIALVNAFKGIIQQLSAVLEQHRYVTAEIAEYAPAAAILDSAFIAEDIPGYDAGITVDHFNRKWLDHKCDELRDPSLSPLIDREARTLRPFVLTVHASHLVTHTHNKVHIVHVDERDGEGERGIDIRSGHIVILKGPNGAGKSLILAGLCGRYEGGSLREGTFHSQIRSLGFGHCLFRCSLSLSMPDSDRERETVLERSAVTMSVLTRIGFVCEFAQAVDAVSLGERETVGGSQGERGRGRERGTRVTVGDVMLRMNHLLSHPTALTEPQEREGAEGEREGAGEREERYPLRGGADKLTGYMLTAMVEALTASGLYARLVEPALGEGERRGGEKEEERGRERYLSLCRYGVSGLSGGEQQRLRLASLFFLERVRYDVFCGRLRKEVIGCLGSHPMQLLVLDEANHHIDSSFPDMLLSLLQTLNPMHLRALAVVLVAHSDSDGDPSTSHPPQDSLLQRRLSVPTSSWYGRVDVLSLSPPILLDCRGERGGIAGEISEEAWQAGHDTATYLQHLHVADRLHEEREEEVMVEGEREKEGVRELPERKPYLMTHSKLTMSTTTK